MRQHNNRRPTEFVDPETWREILDAERAHETRADEPNLAGSDVNLASRGMIVLNTDRVAVSEPTWATRLGVGFELIALGEDGWR